MNARSASVPEAPAPSRQFGKAEAGDVKLRAVTVSDRHAIAKLALDEEQEQFAGSLHDIFDALESSRHPNLEHPFAIESRGETVGFFILREKEAAPHWAPENAVTLHSFRVCRAYHGKGYGRAGTALAVAWVGRNRPNVKRLMLAVNARNIRARTLYLNCGFTDTGMTHCGPIGEQQILSYELSRDSGENV